MFFGKPPAHAEVTTSISGNGNIVNNHIVINSSHSPPLDFQQVPSSSKKEADRRPESDDVSGAGAPTQPLPLSQKRPQDLENVAALLRWDAAIAPLLGRDTELAQLRQWVNSDAHISIKVLHGPGGQGKTRLAAELCRDLAHWSHGWVDLSALAGVHPSGWTGQWVLLVDYPEHQVGQLERLCGLIEQVAARPQRLRVLLIAREADTIKPVFEHRACASWLAPALALPELPTEVGFEMLEAALSMLASWGLRAPAHIARPDFEAWRSQNPSLHGSPLLVTALAIYLAQLPAQSAPAAGPWLGAAQLMAHLLARETQRWAKAAKAHGAPAEALETAMVWATLSGELSDTDLNLHLAPSQGWNQSVRNAVHAARAAVCRAPHASLWAPLEPDLLGAQLVNGWLNRPAEQGLHESKSALATKLLRLDDPPAFARQLNRLHMLAYDQTVRLALCTPSAPQSVQTLLQTWVQAQPVLQQALARGLRARASWPGFPGLFFSVFEQSLAHLPKDAPLHERAQCLANLSNARGAAGDREGAVVLAREAVEIRRCLAKANPAAYEPDLAGSLNNLALYLMETGDREAALVLAQEAVEIRRRLAKVNPAAYEPDLAMSLNNLANHLSETGERADVVVLAREAVDIRRRLAKTNPAAYEPELAASLNNLANCLRETGDWAGALVLVREAVEVHRRLAKANPAAYEPELAGSLNNLAVYLMETGDREAALVLAREAVKIRRRLAKVNPAAYEPDVAMSLNNLAVYLSEMGEHANALVLAKDAVEIRRRLAKANPAAYEPNLAASLNNLAVYLSETGERAAAVVLAREAVGIRRRLAKTNPAAYEPDLAMSLNNLAIRLSETGERADALALAREAVDTYRRLAKGNLTAYEPELAASLNNLASRLSQAGDRAGAMVVAREAVGMYRRLAKTNPAAYEPNLAGSLNNLANRLSETGDRVGALVLAREAVEIRRRLAKANPAAYEPDLAASLNNLANRLSETGERAAAVVLAQEAVEMYRRWAQRHPGVFDENLLIAERSLQYLMGKGG